jgi:hypothetical protein
MIEGGKGMVGKRLKSIDCMGDREIRVGRENRAATMIRIDINNSMKATVVSL